MNGKDKCNLLKSIRCKIAMENGIDYRPAECYFQGECKGTCPRCEAELQKLTVELQKLKDTGKRVAVAGIAAALLAGAAGCVPQPVNENDTIENQETVEPLKEPDTEQTTSELPLEIEGKIAEDPAPAPEDWELTGDVAFPEDMPNE